MEKAKFADALEMVDSLPDEEKELLVEIVRRRLGERKREELIHAVEESRKEYAAGRVRRGTVEDLIRDLTKE
jgi:hypothetical protein